VLLTDLLVTNIQLRFQLQLQLQPLMRTMFREGVFLLTMDHILLEVGKKMDPEEESSLAIISSTMFYLPSMLGFLPPRPLVPIILVFWRVHSRIW
jgi:hypothetical protein